MTEPGTPTSRAASPYRLATWALLVLIWSVLTVGHFKANLQRVAQQGSPLENSELIMGHKIALLGTFRALQDSGVIRSLELQSTLRQASSHHPEDLRLAARCALLLTAADDPTTARELLEQALASSARVPAASPATNALPASAQRTVAPLPSPQELREAFERLWTSEAHEQYNKPALEAGLATLRPLADGWLITWLELRFAQLQHQDSLAEQRRTELAAQAYRVLAVLAALGAGMVGEFVVGLVTLLILLTRGAELDHRAPPAEVEPTWDARLGFAAIVGWMVISEVGGLLAHHAAGGLAAILVGQLVIYGSTLAAIHVLCAGHWERVGIHAHRLGRSLLLGVWGLTANFVLVAVSTLLLAQLLKHHAPSNNVVFQLVHDNQSPWQLAALGLLVAGIGPFFEEVLFRGVLFGALRTALPRWPAALLSGLIFSLVHADPNSTVPLAIMGTLLAVAYDRTRSIWTSTVMHCIWNGQVFVASLFLFS
jgi:membrane protease YdiL (CAAX protease family)